MLHYPLSLLFKTVMGETAPFITDNECILNVYIKVYMLFISMLVVEKILGGKQITVLPS